MIFGDETLPYFATLGLTRDDLEHMGHAIADLRPREQRHGVTPGGIEWRG